MCRQTQGYAVVANQILRLLRLRSILEIRRQPDDRHAHVGSNTHGDHATRHLLAASNTGVEALSDDIRQPEVDGDLDFDVWIVTQELRELRQKDRIGRIFGGSDPNRAGGLLPQFADRRELGLDLLDPRGDRADDAPAGLGHGNAARRAGQKANAKPRLELTDGLAQRRLRNAELCGRFRETSLVRHGDERSEVIQTSALHLSVSLMGLCRLWRLVARRRDSYEWRHGEQLRRDTTRALGGHRSGRRRAGRRTAHVRNRIAGSRARGRSTCRLTGRHAACEWYRASTPARSANYAPRCSP